jgi:hypothetical protein
VAKLLPNGRNQKERVIVLKFPLLESEAWQSLPAPACKIFIELRKRFNGQNNGDITFSYREAAKLVGCSKSSAKRHLEALVWHGFIDMHNKGMMRKRHATTWYLTTEACTYHNDYPTHRWRNFKRL